MSTNITIRDIPNEVYQKIKEQAELHHRSINSELIYHLTKIVSSQIVNPDELIAKAKHIKMRASGTVSIDELQQYIDSGRP